MEPQEVERSEEEKAREREEREQVRAENFVRIAEPRVTKAVGAIKRVGKLSGAHYRYSDKQVADMFGALRAELDRAQRAFGPQQKLEQRVFKFGDAKPDDAQ